MEEKKQSLFDTLKKIDVNDKTDKKNGLTYLSWAFAWGELKKVCPDANYVIYENTLPNGYVVNYFTDGRTAWVKTGVIANGLEHIEELPVMDNRNKAIPLENITSFEVNKTIQRSLTKAVARHGLGLYIYAGEDLPEDAEEVKETKPIQNPKSKVEAKPTATQLDPLMQNSFAPEVEEAEKKQPKMTLGEIYDKSKDDKDYRTRLTWVIQNRPGAMEKVLQLEGALTLHHLDTPVLEKYAEKLLK